MKRLMKHLAILLSSIFVLSVCYAETECGDAVGNDADQAQCADAAVAGSASLPAEAQAQVNELNTKMRYFKAIGFHKQSKEQRDEIAAIYDKYGVPLPDEFKE